MSKECEKLHKLFNNQERFYFPFNKEKIPKNGIYILFEKNEKAHSVDRIVRVGTHTGENKLVSRLSEHFLKENKDRSIFRKNIGRALLSKEKDSFLKIWELDVTTKENKEKYLKDIDFEKQKEIERKVSEYIHNNFSFIVFQVDDNQERLRLESKVISTVSLCQECFGSKEWFGRYSPKKKIRESGLWLVNELYKTPFREEEIEDFKENFK